MGRDAHPARDSMRIPLCVLIAMLLSTAACQGPALLPPDPDGGPDDTYLIGASDTLRISVWKNPELSLSVPVRPDGKISVPLLDDVMAHGLTAEELKEVIATSLEEFVTNPDVTVIVTNPNSRQVAFTGGGVRAGIMPLRRKTRVLEAIMQMGGFNQFAKRSQVKVLRETPEGLVEYRFDYPAYIAGKAPLESNFVLKAGDTIIVPD